MALIKCPECKQSISDKASKCPKCGYPIQEYLNGIAKEVEREDINNDAAQDEGSADIPDTHVEKKIGKKFIRVVVATCVGIIVIVGVGILIGLLTTGLSVKEITISKWRLTDSTNHSDYYEGTITSEQRKPFVAVIGQYNNEERSPQFVYVENGVGIIETSEDTDEDPSIKYKPIGYLFGSQVDVSDIKIDYIDDNYYDSSYSESTTCNVSINIDIGASKTGLLVFDVVNETGNETERNLIAVVVRGKAEYDYYATLPYKARGIDVSIVPKMFCESSSVDTEDYVIEKAYTAEKKERESFKSYSGEEVLSFPDYADGFLIYTRELKEGGDRIRRNVVESLSLFLHDEKCKITTYDSVGENENILMPKYEFNIVGYITWEPLEKENT